MVWSQSLSWHFCCLQKNLEGILSGWACRRFQNVSGPCGTRSQWTLGLDLGLHLSDGYPSHPIPIFAQHKACCCWWWVSWWWEYFKGLEHCQCQHQSLDSSWLLILQGFQNGKLYCRSAHLPRQWLWAWEQEWDHVVWNMSQKNLLCCLLQGLYKELWCQALTRYSLWREQFHLQRRFLRTMSFFAIIKLWSLSCAPTWGIRDW